MIKVFPEPQSRHTPFQSQTGQEFLRGHGIECCRSPIDASWITSTRKAHLAPYIQNFGTTRKYLLWTHEPRLDQTLTKTVTICKEQVRIMNVFNHEVFFDNCYYAEAFAPKLSEPPIKERKLIAFVGKARANGPSVNIAGRDMDLYRLRTQIALEGRQRNILDIYGPKWPRGVSKEESRGNGWQNRKAVILTGRYQFNLCFENTRAPYYCTEKIWHSIACGCLPIYAGAPTISGIGKG